MLRVITSLLVALGLFAVFAFASNEDYEDSVKQDKVYCEMVASGKWVAYLPEIKCPEEK